MQQPKSFMQLMSTLHDTKTCRAYLEKHRWQGVPICPYCKNQSEHHYKLTFKGEFNGLYKCRDCKKRFTVITGTMFERSNVLLEKWFHAIYVFLSHKKGISSVQLSKDIGVTQKTAWFMLTRIRHNLNDTEAMVANKFNGVVQMDETYVGGKNKGRFKNNQGRSLKQKTPVVGLLSGDKVYAVVVPNTNRKTLHSIIYGLVEVGSTVVTDEWPAYQGISKNYRHEVVTHHTKEYVNKNGFHTNGIEGFWSQLKRGLRGIYHVVGRKYLQMYCNEFAYRHNTRKITDGARFYDFMTRQHVKLYYANLRYKPI